MTPLEKCDECGYPMPDVEEYEYSVGIELSQTCDECGYKISWWAEDDEHYQSLDDGEDDPDLEDPDLDN